MLQPVDEVPQGGVECDAQRMARVGGDAAQQQLDGADDLLVDLVVHGAGHPPRAFGTDLTTNRLPVVVHRLRCEANGLAQQILMGVAREHERQGLAEGRGDPQGAQPRGHHVMHQRPHLVVGQRFERLGDAARHLMGDPAAVLGPAEPDRGPARQRHGVELGGDHVAGQEVVLHERAEDAPDPLLARGHDRGVRDRQPEGPAKQGGHGEPVGEAADERRLRRGAHVAEPRVAGLERGGRAEDGGGERQQARRPPLHGVELGLPHGVVGARPDGRWNRHASSAR